jgi:deoxycytidylate deaminase
MSPGSQKPSDGPELFIGLVGAIGTDLARVEQILADSLVRVDYSCRTIRLIELLHSTKWASGLVEQPLYDRYMTHMDGGDLFREKVGGDGLALFAVGRVRQFRKENDPDRNADKLIPNCAYVFRSLKHPGEVERFRKLYGEAFVLVSAYSPRESRVRKLAADIAQSQDSAHSSRFRDKAEHLINRDEEESDLPFGQKVKDTFPAADVFVNASDPDGLQKSIERFVQLLFGYAYHTPTRDEYGMFHAQAAALRSSSLARQVGSAISTPEGEIIALGCNEVPKAGGGFYWPDDRADVRDFKLGYDTSDKLKRMTLSEILERFCKEGSCWFTKEKAEMDRDGRRKEAASLMDGAQIMRAIEYGRSVHAEMAAMLDGARRGVPIKGCTLYTTTYPCHDCARHIIAAGIARVVYIEPYPKSLAQEFHQDAIAFDTTAPRDKVCFASYVGVAPRLYMKLFSMLTRKDPDGNTVVWEKALRLAGSPPTYLHNEKEASTIFVEKTTDGPG